MICRQAKSSRAIMRSGIRKDFDLVVAKIDKFFDKATDLAKDEILFSFKKKTYTTISKILIITKQTYANTRLSINDASSPKIRRR